MAPKMEQRSTSLGSLNSLWGELQHIIVQLYKDDNLSLETVMKIMKRDHGFHASKRQYRTKLAEWGVEKQIKTRDMLAIVSMRQKRLKEQGKQTIVTCRGEVVPTTKIARYIKRKKMAVLPGSPAFPIPSYIKFATPEPIVESSPETTNATASESTDKAASPSTDEATPPRTELEPKTVLYLNNDDMMILHALTQPEPWPLSQYQESDYQDLQLEFPFSADGDFSASFPTESVEESALHSDGLYAQPTPHSLPSLSSDDLDIIRTLRNICDGSVDSIHFTACLEIASKYENANIFRHLVLDALRVDHHSMCGTQLLEKAQTKLHDLAISLLQDGALDQFTFLFRCRIVSPEFARTVVLENGLIQNNTTLLHRLLGTNDQIYAALDLDAILECVPTIRERIDYYGPESTKAVIYAASSADLVSPNGVSALHVAVALLLYDDVSCLLDFGADVNQQSNTGESPLHLLSKMTDSKIMPLCRLLIARGADVNAQDTEGNTCLHVLFRDPQKLWSTALAQLLLSSGADTSLTNHQNESVLVTAISPWPVESVFEVMGWPSL